MTQTSDTLRRVRPLDPTSEAGRAAAEKTGAICAGVIDRLRREGRPVPGDTAVTDGAA